MFSRGFKVIAFLIFPSVCFSVQTQTIYNPFTGKPDYITSLSSQTLPSGSTQYIQNTSSLQSGATFYVSSGTVATQLNAGSVMVGNSLSQGIFNVAGSSTTAPNSSTTNQPFFGYFEASSTQTIVDNLTANGGTAGTDVFNSEGRAVLDSTNSGVTTNLAIGNYWDRIPFPTTKQTIATAVGTWLSKGNTSSDFSQGTVGNSWNLAVEAPFSNVTNSNNAAFFGGNVLMSGSGIATATQLQSPGSDLLTLQSGNLSIIPSVAAGSYSSGGSIYYYASLIRGHVLYQLYSSGALYRLSTLDLSNGTISGGGGTTAVINGAAVSMDVKGKYAYVVSTGTNIMQIYDVSASGSIPSLGTVSVSTPTSIAVQGQYAVIVSSVNNLLSVYNIASSTNPVALGTIAVNSPIKVVLSGKYAYVISSTPKLSIFDLSDPNAIVAKGTITTNLSSPVDLFVSLPFAYVADTTNGFLMYKVLNPASPAFYTSLNSPFSGASQIDIQGKNAFMFDATKSNLYTLDVSQKPPVSLFSLSIFAGASSFATSGQLIFIGGSGGKQGTFTSSSLKSSAASIGKAQIGQLDVLDNVSIENHLDIAGSETVGQNLGVEANAAISGSLQVGATTYGTADKFDVLNNSAGTTSAIAGVTSTGALWSSTSVTAGTTVGGGTQVYRCSGGTAANLLMYGSSGAEQTICTTGGGSLVAVPLYVP